MFFFLPQFTSINSNSFIGRPRFQNTRKKGPKKHPADRYFPSFPHQLFHEFRSFWGHFGVVNLLNSLTYGIQKLCGIWIYIITKQFNFQIPWMFYNKLKKRYPLNKFQPNNKSTNKKTIPLI